MKSISDSSQAMVAADNVNLEFHLQRQNDSSLRDRFIRICKSPIRTLTEKSETLLALNGVSFRASKGDRIALVGKNGAGKTTLCRVLTGIYKPTSGSVEVRGHVRSIIDPSAMIYPDLTGRENARLLMSLLYPNLTDEFEDVLEDALAFSGLGGFLDLPFRHYSNGMQTRLCLSVASCFPADVFILDEVFDGADQEFRDRVSKRMLDLIQNSSVVFFVSHSEEQVRRVCNKALLLNEGQLVQEGDVSEVFHTYKKLIT